MRNSSNTTVEIEGNFVPCYNESVIMFEAINAIGKDKGSFKVAFHSGQFLIQTIRKVTFKPSFKRYTVKTESKGVLTFDELPKGTYFQEGSQDINDKGKAMYYTYDTCGTCLIPIIDTTTGQQVKDISRAGLSIV